MFGHNYGVVLFFSCSIMDTEQLCLMLIFCAIAYLQQKNTKTKQYCQASSQQHQALGDSTGHPLAVMAIFLLLTPKHM